jgi:hypothetical protein
MLKKIQISPFSHLIINLQLGMPIPIFTIFYKVLSKSVKSRPLQLSFGPIQMVICTMGGGRHCGEENGFRGNNIFNIL